MLNTLEVVREVGGGIELSSDRFDHLLDDCKTIMVEKLFIAQMEKLHGRWLLGHRIKTEFEDGGVEHYRPILRRLADGLKTSESELYRCVEFVTKYPDWEKMLEVLPEGKNLSWNIIKEKYLPDIPAAHMPLILPLMEMEDTWGLVKWWAAQADKYMRVRIKDIRYPNMTLSISCVRKDDEGNTPLKLQLKDIGGYFVSLKKWKVEELDGSDYARMNRSIKTLLIKAKGDVAKVKQAIEWTCDKYSDIDWTLETVIKKWAECFKNKDPYDKYDKKKGVRFGR